MKTIFSLLIGTFCYCSLFAQADETLFGEDFQMSASWAGMSYTNSQIHEKTIHQLGLDVGFEYKGNFLAGYQWRKTVDEVVLSDQFNNSQIGLAYHTFLVGYSLPTYRVIHPRFTVGIGPGSLNANGVKDQLFVIQPAAGVEINLFKWARISLDGGYRMVSGTQAAGLSNNDLSKFFMAISLRFGWSWGELN